MQKIIFTLLLMSVLGVSYAQNLNVELFDVANRGDQRYSGSWTYVGPDGAEYGLVGAYSGLAAYSIDEAPITEVGFVGGPGSNWREITVVKDHAYVTTEGSGVGQGLQVISLEYLPDSLHLVRTYDDFFLVDISFKVMYIILIRHTFMSMVRLQLMYPNPMALLSLMSPIHLIFK